MTRLTRISFRLAVLVAGVLAVSSCSAISVNSLPQPGRSYGDGYDIVMAFDNVLNLPMRAKVLFNGVPAGVVTNVELVSSQVNVTARMSAGTRVPANTRASLQQAAVLGDIYVALEPPLPSGARDPDVLPGGVIPLSQTTSPPQLEDTIASLSNFVASGSIQRLQSTVVRLNRLTPPPTEVRRLTARVVEDLEGLSDNLGDVDQLLDGVDRYSDTVSVLIPQIEMVFSPVGQRSLGINLRNLSYIATILPGVGSIALGGWWAFPLINSLADMTGALQRSKHAAEEEIPKFRGLFTDFFLPQDKYPAINITSIVGPDGREMSGDVEDVLRILGAVQ